jgi:hypothetical protein
MRLGVIFPDESSFYQKMGIDIFENYPSVRKVYKKIKKYAGFDIKKTLIYGSDDYEWSEKEKRIAVLVTSVAIYRVWYETFGIKPSFFCGSGTGYLSALVCSGKLSLWYAVMMVRLEKSKVPFFVRTDDKICDTESGLKDDNLPIDVLIEIGPSNVQIKESLQKNQLGRVLRVYYDDPSDKSFILDNLMNKKLFDYLYASRRLLGIATGTQNYSESDERYSEMDTAYMAIMQKVSTALRERYEKADSVFLKDDFLECAGNLKMILQIKKVPRDEVSEHILELQNETALDMRDVFKEWI